MIGMNFMSFLVLLIISIVVSFLLHYVFKFYVRAGFTSFLSKVIMGWIGAWLGPPVFGFWFTGIMYQGVYIIPAILGSFALLILAIDITKSNKGG